VNESLSQSPASPPNSKRHNAFLGGGDLFQFPRPEQPALAAGQAHVYGYVVLSPVTTHNRTQKASALLESVVVHDPYPRTGACLFCGHALGASFPLTSPPKARCRTLIPACLPTTLSMKLISDE
jgi:hypothetical protein